MSTLSVHINGREYRISCGDGEEVHLKHIASELDHRVRDLSRDMGPTTPDSLLLVIASLMLTDELKEVREENDRMKQEAEHTSHSFERNKQLEIDSSLSGTITAITKRLEKLAAA